MGEIINEVRFMGPVMAKKRAHGPGHKFTSKERAAGRRRAEIDELMDQQLLVARDALHQYVSMIADGVAEETGKKIPPDFAEKRSEIVGKVVQLIARDLKSYLKKAYTS